MICLADWWTWTPSATPLQPKKWNAQFSITFNFWWSARLVDGLKPHLPPLSSQENEMLIFVLHSTSDVGQTGQWTRTPTTIPLQPKKWNAHFWITFNFWWLAGLVDGLKLHPPPVSSQKNEILIFVLRWTSDDQLGWLMESNPICHPSPAKKMKSSFLDFVQLLMIGRASWGTQTPFSTLSTPKNEMLIFGLRSTSDDWPGWSMDSNPIHHSSPAKKNEMLIFGLRSLLMICLADWWTWTSSATPLLPKKWNAHFLITFNFWWSAKLVNWLKVHLPALSSQKMKCFFLDYVHFWWSARLVDGLKPHLPPLSSQKNEMLIFGLHSTSDDWPGWSMDSNPICHPSPAKKWNATFWITFNFWWLAGLVNGLKPHPPPLSSQRNEMLIFVLCSTSNDRLGWLMDSNPIHHPS